MSVFLSQIIITHTASSWLLPVPESSWRYTTWLQWPTNPSTEAFVLVYKQLVYDFFIINGAQKIGKLVSQLFPSSFYLWQVCTCNRVSCGKLSSSASQEISRILWDPKFQYHVHNSLLLVPILSQISAFHALPTDFFKIYSNVTLPSKTRSSKWPVYL